MSAQSNVTVYSERAFRAAALGPLPRAPEDRIRFGEELQPVGSYAEVIPYLSAIQDAEALQDHVGSSADSIFEREDGAKDPVADYSTDLGAFPVVGWSGSYGLDDCRSRCLEGAPGISYWIVLYCPNDWVVWVRDLGHADNHKLDYEHRRRIPP